MAHETENDKTYLKLVTLGLFDEAAAYMALLAVNVVLRAQLPKRESVTEAVEGFERDRGIMIQSIDPATGAVLHSQTYHTGSSHEMTAAEKEAHREWWRRNPAADDVEGWRKLYEYADSEDCMEFEDAEIMAIARNYFAAIRSRISRADVLDLATAANDARQLAILSPDLAEEANARAARYDDLAVRVAALMHPEESNG